MAPAAAPLVEFPLPSTVENIETNFEPFYVLHKSSSRKNSRKTNPCGKLRKKAKLSPSGPNGIENPETEGRDDSTLEHLRMEAFELVWSRMETTIKDVLRDTNVKVFDDICRWVYKAFDAIRSSGTPSSSSASRPFPILTRADCKILFTGLVLTKNMEVVDDLLTFEELGSHLKSHRCHVASLSSQELSAKSSIDGCIKSLLRQLLKVTVDSADMFVLASWYREQGYYENPVVVIVEDIERCCGSVLSDFIIMLSEWIVKIPIILIMGVATTIDAPSNVLRSNALQQLCPSKFVLGSPTERMEAVVEAVLLRHCCMFSIGHKVAIFLRKYFLNQDGTLTSFIRAMKIACVQHFSMEPLSFMLVRSIVEEENKGFQDGNRALFLEVLSKHASDFLSDSRYPLVEGTGNNLGNVLSELERWQKGWSAVVQCLYQVGKYGKVQLLDLLCEALDPQLFKPITSENSSRLQQGKGMSFSSSCELQYQFSSRKDGYIYQAIRKVRDLPAELLHQLLVSWEKITGCVPEIHEKVKDLLLAFKLGDGKSSEKAIADVSKRHASQKDLFIKYPKPMIEKAESFLSSLVSEHMRPIESVPFHELICFKDVRKLQLALIGDPRRRIQVDLLEFQKIIKCTCCNENRNSLLPCAHDSTIMYNLAQEHGDLINLHDWFQSFKTVVSHPRTKGNHRTKQGSTPKKKKDKPILENKSDASIQARFCTAVTELQITGLLRMPSKRRPDYVQRVAFGL
ncbi:origin of replication complex subunit 3 isoform X1 [Cucurbita pepo subsp. pepo]|uniref:origin of replication complex subunit 3 isoform X1 n=1 Tax=Cucurbita pepo subsp. pepo TaxID=3664 RepID=UPI000C9D6B04|nr:origin of replication complex subunit 3 isoform X1 [Cucurbita pepo subsp. pepo]